MTDASISDDVRVASVSDFIKTDSYLASFNQAWFQEEGVLTASYNDKNNEVTLLNNANVLKTATYAIDENKIIITKNQKDIGSDEFIYMDNKLALAVTAKNDVFVWSKALEPTAFTATELDGQTWHYVADDSTSKTPKITNTALTFSASTGQVTIEEAGEQTTIPYTVNAGIYSFAAPSEKNVTITFSKMVGNEDMIIIKDSLGKPASY